MSNIRLKDFLDQWDKLEKGNAEQVFSIGFVQKNGEARFVNRAVKSGVRYSMKDNEHRACLPVDQDGNATDHVIPFSIWRVTQFNGNNVIL